MLATLLLLLQANDGLIRAARERMTAERRCVVDPNATDITVCGLRHADRYRVPFADASTRRSDDVTTSRAALVHARTPMEDMGPFLVGGGAAGVRVTQSFGAGAGSGGTGLGTLRKPAP